ncbi:MAG: hypothetical protein ABIP94_03050 [Planctomycetota bacterium]
MTALPRRREIARQSEELVRPLMRSFLVEWTKSYRPVMGVLLMTSEALAHPGACDDMPDGMRQAADYCLQNGRVFMFVHTARNIAKRLVGEDSTTILIRTDLRRATDPTRVFVLVTDRDGTEVFQIEDYALEGGAA